MARAQELHNDVLNECLDLTEELKRGNVSKEDMADLGFLCREIERVADEVRKEVSARKEFVSKLIYVEVCREQINTGQAITKVDGKLASATPDVKVNARFPEKGSPDHDRLLQHFGIPLDCSKYIKLDWKAMAELVTKCKEEGRPLPPGLGDEYNLYPATYRRRTGKQTADDHDDSNW